MAAVFSLTGYLGVNFVLALISSFGAVTGSLRPLMMIAKTNLIYL